MTNSLLSHYTQQILTSDVSRDGEFPGSTDSLYHKYQRHINDI